MEQLDSDIPLGKATVGIIYNLKSGKALKSEDAEAEYDNIETVMSLKRVFESDGLTVKLLEADLSLPEKLAAVHLDIAFNIAEGLHGRGREAMVPALLNMYNVPFVGSDETTLAIALDKALTKRLLASAHVHTPACCVVSSADRHVKGLKYPLIVKPNAEGSSKGIMDKCVVRDRHELNALLENNFALYDEEMLVEEYIEGREFTVGLLGNGNSLKCFEPMEIAFRRPTQDGFSVYSFNVKKDYKKLISYHCPADIDRSIKEDMVKAARKAFTLLGCRDFARVDFRVDNNGKVYFIEINPLPGLAPEYSDYPMLAGFCGTGYDQLVMDVLKAGAARCGIDLKGGSVNG